MHGYLVPDCTAVKSMHGTAWLDTHRTCNQQIIGSIALQGCYAGASMMTMSICIWQYVVVAAKLHT